MHDGNTGKLYFLRDRGRRLMPRQTRKRPEGTRDPVGERRYPSPQEAQWLGSVLFAAATYLVLYWVAVATDVFGIENPETSGLWRYSFLPADLFVAVAAAIGGFDLVARGGKRDVFVLLAAGGAIFLALERLAYRISAGAHHILTPGERLEITAMGIFLCVGVWAISHSMRLRPDRSV